MLSCWSGCRRRPGCPRLSGWPGARCKPSTTAACWSASTPASCPLPCNRGPRTSAASPWTWVGSSTPPRPSIFHRRYRPGRRRSRRCWRNAPGSWARRFGAVTSSSACRSTRTRWPSTSTARTDCTGWSPAIWLGATAPAAWSASRPASVFPAPRRPRCPASAMSRSPSPKVFPVACCGRRVLGADLAISQPRWLSRFTDAARQADRYRAGRVLVAGDAAHIQLPAGGPGMTTGLQDAANLGWKLAAQIRGWAPPGLLDTYHAERHPVGERMLSFTRAQGVLLAPGDHVSALRDLMGELLTHEQTLRYVVDRLLGLDIRYDQDGSPAHPLTGGLAPDLTLTTDNGSARLATLMHTARPVLLDLAHEDRLRDAAAGWKDRVQITMARSDEPLDGILVRPDGYVAWAASPDDGDIDDLHQALTTWFGAAG